MLDLARKSWMMRRRCKQIIPKYNWPSCARNGGTKKRAREITEQVGRGGGDATQPSQKSAGQVAQGAGELHRVLVEMSVGPLDLDVVPVKSRSLQLTGFQTNIKLITNKMCFEHAALSNVGASTLNLKYRNENKSRRNKYINDFFVNVLAAMEPIGLPLARVIYEKTQTARPPHPND